LPRIAYRRPLARDPERFFLASITASDCFDLPFERFAVLGGESIIKRTEATRFGLNPRLRPISSGEGTRFLTTKVAILQHYKLFSD